MPRLLPPVLIAAMLAGPAWGTIVLPDLGDASQSAFSQVEEQQLANAIMREVESDPAYVDDPELNDYLNGLGYNLVAASSDNFKNFTFFAVRDPTLNAFALPGANIGIHTGLLAATRNESELAGVLAHEIAHISQKHLARMIEGQKQTALPSLAALVIAILAARSDGQLAQAAIAAGQAAAIQGQLDFSRDFEREADRTGLQILVDAGYNPRGMADFFERLQKNSRLVENNAPAYLRTHPLTHSRIADMLDRLGELPYKQHVDTIEYQLLRARYRGLSRPPQDAVALFEAELRGSEDHASRFGLVEALLRSKEIARARETYRPFLKADLSSPMIERLGAELSLAAGARDEGLRLYREAIRKHPGSAPLSYAYAQALLSSNQVDVALAFLNQRLSLHPDDPNLYALKSSAHASLGQKLLMHQAQAEVLLRRHNLPGAVEQLELGIKAADGDFYQTSIAEARLRELRTRLKPEIAAGSATSGKFVPK
jgi:predicted Zn-dependent protease